MTHERKDTMKSVTGRITAVFLCAGIAASSVWADRYVSPAGGNTPPYDNWGNAATSIQTAINAAGADETIWVTNGAAFVLSAEISLNKAVTVRGYGEPKPVVNGNGAVRGFNISSSGATLDGLVVSNGYNASMGGGIYMSAGLVRNCLVISNSVPTQSGSVIGGGVYMTGGTVSNCVIRDNWCHYWGGGVGIQGASAKLLACILDGNRQITIRPAGGPRAGGVYVDQAALIDDCTFTNNRASGGAGGISILGAARVLNCRFYANQGVAGGGAEMNTAGLVSNCVFVGNTGTSEGGAMYIDNGLTVNCAMRNNTAGGSGGGGTMTRGTSRAILRNCLIVGNTATSYAGGVISIQPNGLILENCTIADNNQYGVFEWMDNAVLKTNSIVYFNTNNVHRSNNWGTSCTTPAVTGADNITADPQFANRAGGDYTLLKTSPCLDAGLGRTWMTDGLDLAGKPRLAYKVRGATGEKLPDMGAYEYNPPPPLGTTVSVR